MADDFGDKTEAPTPRRRADAREQGNIARTPDLAAAALLIGVMMALKFAGPGLVHALRTLVGAMLSPSSLSAFAPADLGRALAWTVRVVGLALLPVLGAAVGIALAVNLLQVGLVFSGKRLVPNLGALNPIKGVGRIFRGGQGFVQLLMNVLKVTLVGLVVYSAMRSRAELIVTSQQLDFMQIFALGATTVFDVAVRVGLLLLFLAIVDYAYQRWRVERQLMMTKQEVKEEMRRQEGDPQVKQRRRQIAIQRHLKRLRKDVPTADVVVTNPTHFAVALKYDAAAMRAPKVVAKGQDLMAQRIREIAVEFGVPILERAPLARALYRLVEVGQEIPEQFYAAVAEILAYVYELSGKFRRKIA
ncbi:MAG: flagellar biosynthesis protein FlhB [Tepidisphaeraceae bacterium]